MSDQYKETIRRIVEEGFGAGRFEVFDETLAESYLGYGAAPEPLRGPEGVKEFVRTYRAAFPDLQTRVDDIVAEGDTVAYRWSARGTHQGELFGIAPTRKQVTIWGCSFSRFSGGKIVEDWDAFDSGAIMQQLGVAPELAQA